MASRIAMDPFLILTNLGKDGLSIPSTAGLVLTGKGNWPGTAVRPGSAARYDPTGRAYVLPGSKRSSAICARRQLGASFLRRCITVNQTVLVVVVTYSGRGILRIVEYIDKPHVFLLDFLQVPCTVLIRIVHQIIYLSIKALIDCPGIGSSIAIRINGSPRNLPFLFVFVS